MERLRIHCDLLSAIGAQMPWMYTLAHSKEGTKIPFGKFMISRAGLREKQKQETMSVEALAHWVNS